VVEGPFAGALSGDNLIVTAARAAVASVPGLKLGRFHLVKNLPVASGLGGGSADAAAALRLIARANHGAISPSALMQLAPSLGSDASVCLASRPALITGRGEKVEPVGDFPSCGVLLANPGRPLATEAVYAALEAAPLPEEPHHSAGGLAFSDFGSFVDYLLPRGNDLEKPAARFAPEIENVLAALLALPGAHIARLSGSGATCFALFGTEDEAKRAGAALAAQYPTWWVAASALKN
jgi:4-diphosphocytidyl-2-C-methyl-D-erythritol kinase